MSASKLKPAQGAGIQPPVMIQPEKKPVQPPQPPVMTGDKDDENEFQPISFAMVRRLLGWLKPYWRTYLVAALFGIVALLLELAAPLIQQRIIDEAIPSGKASEIFKLAGLWLGLMAVSIALDTVQISLTRQAGEQVVNDMRGAVFGKLQQLSMSFFDRTKLGRIVTRGTSDMDALREPVVSGINMVVLSMLMMIGAAAMILWTDWKLFLAVAWLAPLLAYCNQRYRVKIGGYHQLARAGYSRVASNIAENIVGSRVVSAFNRQDENLETFNELQEQNTRNNVRCSHITGIYQPVLEGIKFAGQVIVLAYGGVQVMHGKLTTGQVIQVFFYWDFYMRPTLFMGNFYNTLMGAMASCERIFGLLDMPPGLADQPGAQPLKEVRGQVNFEHVTFGYNPERPVLHDITVEIPAGQTVALVGATGSGKSSFVSLLARFYEYQQGRILIDGKDVRGVTGESIHRHMGLVLQMNYLFTGTVMQNIRYPRPEAGDEEVFAAAKALGLHETFSNLPDGYNTEVGERGGSVSLGIRQLICFTRVLLANPSLFLLDEATASIDTVTEAKVQAALETLVRGRTTIIVAHRLSTIVKADCILVLEQGRIIERGTHAELLERKGHYARLYERFVSHHAHWEGGD